MPQLVALLLAVLFVFCVVPVILQWILAAILWFLQTIVLPLLLSVPAVVVVLLLTGFFLASYKAAKNYVSAINEHIEPEHPPGMRDGLGLFIRGSLIFVLGASTVLVYLTQLGIVGWGAFLIGDEVVNWVENYFRGIEFPAFEIHYPCSD